jgi:hypothetical protein
MTPSATTPALFDASGWRLPSASHRTFSRSPKWFYRTSETVSDVASALGRTARHMPGGAAVTAAAFEAAVAGIKASLAAEPALSSLLKGVHVPFVLPRLEGLTDLGGVLEQHLLPAVSAAHQEARPDCHFKAVLQDKTSLQGKLSVTPHSRYEALLAAVAEGPVCGLYFPQALQEYDVDSQAEQMKELPAFAGLVLSGPLDVAAALVACPELLFHADAYSPVLCLSAVQHDDPRLMCCFKSYGPHLEFWCVTQMLTPTLKQVSEQWAGGLTVFAPLPG